MDFLTGLSLAMGAGGLLAAAFAFAGIRAFEREMKHKH